MPLRITCINESHGYHQDPHHAIESLGWVNDNDGERGKSSRVEIYTWLKNKGGSAYVVDRAGNRASVHPRENSAGTKYVQTAADGKWTDNLLYLPECK